jgi:Zn-dependent metalloprotease/PKD repeat protein
MNAKGIRFFLFMLVCGLLLHTAAAQKLQHDPRPLDGLDRSTIPAYSSVEAFLAAHSAADLLSAATVVGQSARTIRTLPPMQVAGTSRSAGWTSSATAFDDVRIERAPNGTVRWMTGAISERNVSLASAGKAGTMAAYEEAAALTVQEYAGALGLSDPIDELRPIRTQIDELGYVHLRYEQVYEGVPVWGRDLYVHFDNAGAAYAINGTYEPTPRDLETRPGISSDNAHQIVVADLKAKGRWAPVPESAARRLGLDGVESQLVLYPDIDGRLRPAYEISLHPNLIEWYSYIVDARTSDILNRIARHCSILPHDDTLPPPDASGLRLPQAHAHAHAPNTTSPSPTSLTSAPFPTSLTSPPSRTGSFLDANGAALDGAGRNLRVYRHDDGGHHLIWDLPNLDPNTFQFPEFSKGGIFTFTADNTDGDQDGQITTVVSTDNTWADPASVSAHDNARILYEYYKSTFDRNAIDGVDSPIFSVVHITKGGVPMDNAYWNGRFMAYGDGAQAFEPLAGALDVAAHEMTHGVVEHTSGLIYQFQPGALNESFADVFGVMLDRDDFLLGEDISRPEFGPALRDMLNPDNAQLNQPQPAHMNEYRNLTIDQDNGGVHINSGIPNRAAALLIQAIGHDKVQDIYYRALTNYLTRNSQFGDARIAVEQSAKDLFGEGAAEVAAVQEAFDAVGVTQSTGTGGEGGNDLPPVTGGLSIITFLLEDGSIGVLDVTDPNNLQFGVFEDPAAAARANLETFDFAQLTAPRGGERIWFVNPQGQLAYIDVQTGEVSVFTDLQISQAGDLWNASVSPDESFVALVSAYANDPTLYIFNGEQIGAVPLMPETSQEGIQVQTIQYPDIVSWSPHPQIPRIAFDAYNEVEMRDGSMSFWGIYEIDFGSDQIYNLMPAQPTGLSVGNVVYSNTDPDIIAFNAIDETNTWDIVLGNFAEGQIFPLEIPAIEFEGGARLLDAQRPTFSPDDAMVAFTSPAYGILGFIDLAAQELSFLDMEASVFNPRWFVLGGAGGAENQAPTAAFTVSATAGDAPLNVTVDASASSDPEGGAVTYRWDFGDGTIGSGVTATHTYVQTGSFTITLNVTDGGGLSGTATGQVDVSAGAVSAEPGAELPRTVALHQNHPNPFNPATVLRFDLPAALEADLTVFDMLGRPVSRLISRTMEAGTHEVRFEADNLPSGVYLARLKAGETVQTRKMLLMR